MKKKRKSVPQQKPAPVDDEAWFEFATNHLLEHPSDAPVIIAAMLGGIHDEMVALVEIFERIGRYR